MTDWLTTVERINEGGVVLVLLVGLMLLGKYVLKLHDKIDALHTLYDADRARREKEVADLFRAMIDQAERYGKESLEAQAELQERMVTLMGQNAPLLERAADVIQKMVVRMEAQAMASGK